VLFLADSIENPMKGFSVLREALREMPEDTRPMLLIVGKGRPNVPAGIRFIHMGSLVDEQRVVETYNAADVFIIPSFHENYPNTILEALACGTPVVGFDVGGIGEMVETGVTGELVGGSPVSNGLTQALSRLFGTPGSLEAMKKTSRQWAVCHGRIEEQVTRYSALYERFLS